VSKSLGVLPHLPIFEASFAKNLKPQELANMIWSAAKPKEQTLLNVVPALQAEIPRLAQQFEAQHVANIIWAAAALREEFPKLLNSVPSLAEEVPRETSRAVHSQKQWVMFSTPHI